MSGHEYIRSYVCISLKSQMYINDSILRCIKDKLLKKEAGYTCYVFWYAKRYYNWIAMEHLAPNSTFTVIIIQWLLNTASMHCDEIQTEEH